MAVRPIRLFPDECLSKLCHTVRKFDHELANLVEDLTSTLYQSPGVGLAAPQIGVLQRVSVVDVRHRAKREKVPPNHGVLVLVNPTLVRGEGIQIPREGCLSVPELLANVRRFERVTVSAFNASGISYEISSEGFEALALQHEIDHLEGRLFLDRVANLKTDIFRRKNYG